MQRHRVFSSFLVAVLLVPISMKTTFAQSTSASDKGDRLLDKYTSVQLTTDLSELSENERKMIPLLIEAAREMDAAFWVQAYGERESLITTIDDPALEQFAEINYGPWDRLDGNEPFCHHFAKAIDQFETPVSRFHRLLVGAGGQNDALDIKRGGIFPIVHGVRSLALERKLTETNSMERVRRLQDTGIFDRAMADDLVQSLSFLMELRLRAQLHHQGQDGSDTLISPDRLSTLERDLLKDSFLVVKRFKDLVRHHFRLSRL